MEKLELPENLRLENYPTRIHAATFDRLDLAVEFRAGKEGVGATVKGFIDAIAKHDAIVQTMEEAIKNVEECKRVYRKRNRLFRNLDSAWNLLLTNPTEFAEYNELLPKMKNMEQRLAAMDDPETKAKMTTQYERFREIEPRCSKQLIIYNSYSEARNERDKAVKKLLETEKHLREVKEQENTLASLISDDHILADETKKSMTNLFANVHVGYLLQSVNNERFDTMPFEDVIKRVRKMKPPHKAEFRRYDFRYDPFNAQWNSLPELRAMGVCIEDPLLQRMSFISLAGQGDAKAVYELLRQGEDPNGQDLTGNTALVAAAVGGHVDVVEMLIKARADVNSRDKNMMTPLLYCVNRGNMEMVRLLLDHGADRSYLDHNLRGTVFYAILSGNIHLVKFFLKKDQLHRTDRLWGFTPLHLAANLGQLETVEFLLDKGCSIFRLDRKQRTPEEVAEESGHIEVHQRLIEERVNNPGQVIHTVGDDRALQFWVGDSEALDAVWCSDADITHLIYFKAQDAPLPPHTAWLKKERFVQWQVYPVDVLEEDGDAQDNWAGLQAHIDSVVTYVSRAIEDIQRSNAEALREAVQAQQALASENHSMSTQGHHQSSGTSNNTHDNTDGGSSAGSVSSSVLTGGATHVAHKRLKVVFVDDHGVSLAPAMLCIFLLLKYQVRCSETLKQLQRLRPRVRIGRNVWRGVDLLQQALDTKVMQRMNAKLRGTAVNSVAF